MLPGPDRVIECPNCGAFHKVFSLQSGNTFGASLWTDGKMIAPMLPEPPDITKCHQCRSIFWVSDARQAGEIPPFAIEPAGIDDSWKNAPDATELTEAECFEAIESGLGSTREKETRLRVLTWWRGNDVYREAGHARHVEAGARPVKSAGNMRGLFSLLDDKDPYQRIMKAEIARELGDFKEALKLLRQVADERYQAAKNTILRLCKARRTDLAQIEDA